MENASKALIIAGAILISILIITLGIIIYRQAAGIVNTDAMSAVEIESFNTKFTQYEGEQRGSTVRAIYSSVLAHNISQDSNDRRINIKGPDSNTDLAEDATQLPVGLNNGIKTGSMYTVTCTMGTSGGEKGLVKTITISNITSTNTTNP